MGLNIKVLLTVLLCVTVSTVMGSVTGSSVVGEIISSYSCCDRSIKFNQLCEIICKMDDQNFARIYQDNNQCISPCKTIKDGRMILDACMNVTLTTVCTDMMGTTKETQNTYLGQTCPQPHVSRMSPVLGFMGFLPLVVFWIPLFLK